MTGGKKNDSGKPPITLIPSCAITGMANAFAYGANKYGADNFRQGIKYRRLADAAMRHLLAFIEGEDTDIESNNPHLDHALASLAMLKFMTEHKPDMDDRWKPEVVTFQPTDPSPFDPSITKYDIELVQEYDIELVQGKISPYAKIITNIGG